MFPSTFSPTFQLFAPFRTRWALTGHVPSDFVPVNRFRVTVHVFAQFSAVCTVPDALGVYGTRSTFSPRLTDFAFPSTFSPSFQLFAPFRTCWALTGHVPSFFIPVHRFRVSVHVFAQFNLFSQFRTCWALTGHVPSDFVPANRFRVSVHVFAQFSAVCTVSGRVCR